MIPAKLLIALMAAFTVQMVYADNTLKHDPFEQPLMPASLPNSIESLDSENEKAEPWNPDLIAVLVAGNNSLVNLAGEILRIGESTDGYRLVEVRDQEATFEKGNKRIMLNMTRNVTQNDKSGGVR